MWVQGNLLARGQLISGYTAEEDDASSLNNHLLSLFIFLCRSGLPWTLGNALPSTHNHPEHWDCRCETLQVAEFSVLR